MAVDIDHLLSGSDADTTPRPRALEEPVNLVGAGGIIVEQGDDAVILRLTDEATSRASAVLAEDVVEDPFAEMSFRVSMTGENHDIILIKAGHFSHVYWAETAWVNEEIDIAEYQLTGVTLPAYVYVVVPMKTFSNATSGNDYRVPFIESNYGPFDIEGTYYNVALKYTTDFTGVDTTALLASTTLVQAIPTRWPTDDGDYHRWIAFIHSDGTVDQKAFGDFTVPQTFRTRINDLVIS